MVEECIKYDTVTIVWEELGSFLNFCSINFKSENILLEIYVRSSNTSGNSYQNSWHHISKRNINSSSWKCEDKEISLQFTYVLCKTWRSSTSDNENHCLLEYDIIESVNKIIFLNIIKCYKPTQIQVKIFCNLEKRILVHLNYLLKVLTQVFYE
jgi:hypothetical protein